MKNWKPTHFFLISIGVILLDQLTKYLVHQNMAYQEEIHLFGFIKLNYQLNPGMAWGTSLEFLGDAKKMTLTVFRLIVSGFIPVYLINLYKKGAHSGLILCIAFILGGAVGNLIDGLFYGMLDPEYLLVYNKWDMEFLHGYVVDMIYFDLYHGSLPLVGHVDLWPVFNVADSSIFCSVIAIMILNKKFFPEEEKEGN